MECSIGQRFGSHAAAIARGTKWQPAMKSKKKKSEASSKEEALEAVKQSKPVKQEQQAMGTVSKRDPGFRFNGKSFPSLLLDSGSQHQCCHFNEPGSHEESQRRASGLATVVVRDEKWDRVDRKIESLTCLIQSRGMYELGWRKEIRLQINHVCIGKLSIVKLDPDLMMNH